MLGDFTGPIANLFSDVKIAEGESPEPMDRVFFRTHYYNNLNKSRWTSPIEPIHNVDLFRNTFGFEKAFADQSVSFGLRIPFNTINADGKPFHLQPDPNIGTLLPSFKDEGFDTTLLGNISAILKSVVWEDRQGGDLISARRHSQFSHRIEHENRPGDVHPLFIQPFGGYIFNSGDMFVQGFSSLTLPIASAESIVMFNDVGVGYWLMRNRSGLISGLVPTIELHVATPLRQVDLIDGVLGSNDGFHVFNVVNATAGATVLLSNNSTLALGMVVPLTWPETVRCGNPESVQFPILIVGGEDCAMLHSEFSNRRFVCVEFGLGRA